MRRVDPLTSVATVIIILIICGLFVVKGYVVGHLPDLHRRSKLNKGWRAIEDHWIRHPYESERFPSEENVVTFQR